MRASKARLNREKNLPNTKAKSFSKKSFLAPWGLSNILAIAGLRVSELMAERIVETAMVKANCLKKRPTTPPMKAQGINTAESTKATPITGPVTSSIAWMVASRGLSPCEINLSTFSTTTIASSTTMPMDNTKPNKESVLRLNPIRPIMAKVPTTATGTAIKGIRVARQFCRKSNTTSATNRMASRKVRATCSMESLI